MELENFNLQRLRELGQQKIKVKRKINNKLQILSLLPTEGYEDVMVNIHKNLIEEIISENENFKLEIQHFQEKLDMIKKEKREKKSKNKTKKDERKKKTENEPSVAVPREYSKTLFNCYNYNEYNEDGSRKIILKKDLYNQNFTMMFRSVLQSATYPVHNEINSFIFNWKLQDFESILMTTISGPEDSSAEDLTYGQFASCEAISLYPHCPGRPYREGDPICDRFQLALYSNRIIVCLTDGCNWGDRPRKASRIANKTIVNYLKENVDKIKNIQSSIFSLLAAIADAQITIIDGNEEWTPGTTTVSCGLLLEVDQEYVENNFVLEQEQTAEKSILTPTKWVFVSANVGDCKIIHIALREKLKIIDITGTIRSNSTDLTDPGGRLGSFKDGWPDLRNLTVNYHPADEGDIICVMSDGVHDNFDPQTVGLSPRDFDIDFDDWEKAPEQIVSEIKKLYFTKSLEHLFGSEEILTPKIIKDKLITHCIQLTTKSRNFLSQNPTLKVPSNYQQYPGKLDHTSLACFRVGRTNRLSKSDSNGVLFNGRKNIIIRNNQKIGFQEPSPDIISEIKDALKIVTPTKKRSLSDSPFKITPLKAVSRIPSASSSGSWTVAKKPSVSKDQT